MLRGQYLERPTLIPVGSLVLEAVSHRGHRRPGLLILSPPPAVGSGMDDVVAAELAFAAAHAGHPTLRFNYRGVGASQGERPSSAQALLDDALAALALAADNAEGVAPVVASIGASDAVALQLARHTHVSGLVLVSPALATPDELPTQLPVAIVFGALEPALARWSADRSWSLTVAPGATSTYQQHLPVVGRAAVELLGRL